MSDGILTTTTDNQSAWLLHDGFGGHIFDVFITKQDAEYVKNWHGDRHGEGPLQIQEIPLRSVMYEESK